MTTETVIALTPASRATSWRVGALLLRIGLERIIQQKNATLTLNESLKNNNLTINQVIRLNESPKTIE
jgi:hypothetical protein